MICPSLKMEMQKFLPATAAQAAADQDRHDDDQSGGKQSAHPASGRVRRLWVGVTLRFVIRRITWWHLDQSLSHREGHGVRSVTQLES